MLKPLFNVFLPYSKYHLEQCKLYKDRYFIGLETDFHSTINDLDN